MTIAHALILSLVEGITEFIPVSSTGHLILAAHILGVAQTPFAKTFEIAIQSGAILAVIVLYLNTLLKNTKLFRPLAIAFIPAAVVGLLLYKIIKGFFLENVWVVIWALVIGGCVLIAVERYLMRRESGKKDLRSVSDTDALIIGLGQSLAVIPGVSRAGATIVSGLCLGLSRETAVEFSFLLAVPTVLAATGLDLVKSAGTITPDQTGLLSIGLLGAFISALVAVRTFVSYVKKHTLAVFGVYRILLAGIFVLFLKT